MAACGRPFRFTGIRRAGIHFHFSSAHMPRAVERDRRAMMSVVLVTGGSGFIASYCIAQLLAAGHQVHTTVRNLNREADVRAMLREAGAEAGERLSFFAADLVSDAGWREAAAGCEYVLHVASPLLQSVPRDEDELIVPARDGTLRVLRASREAGVKRVVLTSSFAAIGHGQKPQQAPFNETNWTDVNGRDASPYAKSKTLAERAAWDFVANRDAALELSVINPVMVLGPVVGPDYSAPILLVKRLMDGAVPGCPRLYFGIVDVRDIADLHIRAMTDPAAKGERFLAAAGDFVSIRQIAEVLKDRLGTAARRVPTREVPNWLVHVFAFFDPSRFCRNSARSRTAAVKRRGVSWAGLRARARTPSQRPAKASSGLAC
jgi:dihydroflavonol-4-reductase